jgi:cysteine desulfurase
MALFLDVNAHLPLNPKALEAYISFNRSSSGHGHPLSTSVLGRQAACELENARKRIALAIGAEPNQIIFTSSCTQACEWGLEILKAQNFNTVYCSTIEHKSVAAKARELFGDHDLLVNRNGAVACGFLPEGKSAFVCIHVQNEIGTIQPIEDIHVPFFCDMAQSLGKVSVDVSKLPNLKIAAFGGHKFGGSSSVGILYLQNPKWWKELGSGSRYFYDRPGTPDVGMIIATSIALEEAVKSLSVRYEKALRFRAIVESAVRSIGIEVIGDNVPRIPHVSFLNIGKKMAPWIMSQLESEEIYVGLGSACGSLYSNANPIISALGRGGHANDYIRISQWGEYSEVEAKTVAKALLKYCPR